MSKQSYAEYQEELRGRLLPPTPAGIDERETQLWNRCVDVIREHLGNDETRWPERYQECGAVFDLLGKALNVSREPQKPPHMHYCGLDADHEGKCAAVVTRMFGV